MAAMMNNLKELKSLGIEEGFAKRIVREYGDTAMERIRENPYRLVEDFFGVDFKEADKLAGKLEISPENDERIRSGILFGLSKFNENGSTYAPEDQLIEQVGEFILGLPRESLEDAMINMVFDGDIHIAEIEGTRAIYKTEYYEAEAGIAAALSALSRVAPQKPVGDIRGQLLLIERDTGLRLSENQRETIDSVLRNSVSVITGGPGTGKTTIINSIISLLAASGEKTAICAPTGRAAKRIKEATGRNATTVHRLLEAEIDENSNTVFFRRCSEYPLDHDAVVVDEASMMDIFLMSALLEAVKPGTRLIIVGDADQLPSVGPGNVLRDIIESEYINAFELTEIFRQEKESLIVTNAHKINRGEYPEPDSGEGDFLLLRKATKVEAIETIKDLMLNGIPGYHSAGSEPQDIQVITMTKLGDLGTGNLNRVLQGTLNKTAPGKPEVMDKWGRIFRTGDKVMQIRNNYRLEWKRSDDFSEGKGVFNGEIGEIVSIDEDFKQITVVYDEFRYVVYEFESLSELELAYAITVHKSQGSEFPVVMMPVMWTTPKLATRNLLYTAVTRGRDMVILIGSERQLKSMVDNNPINERNTGLRSMLRNLI